LNSKAISVGAEEAGRMSNTARKVAASLSQTTDMIFVILYQ
jgi:hypothetical protein